MRPWCVEHVIVVLWLTMPISGGGPLAAPRPGRRVETVPWSLVAAGPAFRSAGRRFGGAAARREPRPPGVPLPSAGADHFSSALLAARGFPVRRTDPVEAARQALAEKAHYPWYDRESDQLRRIDVSVVDDVPNPDNRHSSWESRPANRPSLRGLRPTGLERLLHLMLTVLFWTVLAGLVTALVWLLIRAFVEREARQAARSPTTQVVPAGSDVDRVEKLPFQVARTQSDLLAEARRCYEAGNYREAIVYLFSYELVQLDKHRFIRLARGKTNRQYLGEVRPQPRLFQILQATMVAFEEVFFGDHDLERNQFERCWRGLGDFHSLMQQEAGG